MSIRKTQHQARGFSSRELDRIMVCFGGRYAERDRSLILLGISTGAKISELLSLSVSDVDRDDVCSHFGDIGISCISLNNDGYVAIDRLLKWHIRVFGELVSDRPLFASRQGDAGGEVKALTRQQAHRILQKACSQAGINSIGISTNSLRLTHQNRLYCVDVLSGVSTNPYIVSVAD